MGCFKLFQQTCPTVVFLKSTASFISELISFPSDVGVCWNTALVLKGLIHSTFFIYRGSRVKRSHLSLSRFNSIQWCLLHFQDPRDSLEDDGNGKRKPPRPHERDTEVKKKGKAQEMKRSWCCLLGRFKVHIGPEPGRKASLLWTSCHLIVFTSHVLLWMVFGLAGSWRMNVFLNRLVSQNGLKINAIFCHFPTAEVDPYWEEETYN